MNKFVIVLAIGIISAVLYVGYGFVNVKYYTREPNEFENAYFAMTLNIKNPRELGLCEKISPKAIFTARFADSDHQISYVRSECFFAEALFTKNTKLCDNVKTISMLFLNGNAISKTNCIDEIHNTTSIYEMAGASFNAEKIMKYLGYNETNIPEFYQKDPPIDYDGYYLEIMNTNSFIQKLKSLPDFSSTSSSG